MYHRFDNLFFKHNYTITQPLSGTFSSLTTKLSKSAARLPFHGPANTVRKFIHPGWHRQAPAARIPDVSAPLPARVLAPVAPRTHVDRAGVAAGRWAWTTLGGEAPKVPIEAGWRGERWRTHHLRPIATSDGSPCSLSCARVTRKKRAPSVTGEQYNSDPLDGRSFHFNSPVS